LGGGLAAPAGGFGEGFRSGHGANLATLGQDIMFIFPEGFRRSRAICNPARLITLTYEDYLPFAPRPYLRFISPVIKPEDIRAVSDYGSTTVRYFGVSPEYNQIRSVPLGTGRWSMTRTTRNTAGCGGGLGVAEECFSRRRGGRNHAAERQSALT